VDLLGSSDDQQFGLQHFALQEPEKVVMWIGGHTLYRHRLGSCGSGASLPLTWRASMGMLAVRWSNSGEVQGETHEIGERAVVEGAFVSSPQDHAGRASCL
jgi:hypothetical protein